MQFVVATSMWDGGAGRALTHGIRELGHRVREVDTSAFIPSAVTLIGRMHARATLRLAVRQYNAAIVAAATESEAHALLTVKGAFIQAETVCSLNQSGLKTLNYYPDSEFTHRGLTFDQVKQYGHVVTTKSYHLPLLNESLGSSRVHFVHHGYVPSLHHPPIGPRPEQDIDISYVGNPTSAKAQELLALVPFAETHVVRIFGTGWNAFLGDTPLSKCVRPRLWGDEYAWAIARSKVSLGLHSGVTRTPGWADLVSTRTFEIPACAGFMLHVDNEEVRELFRPEEEIALYSGSADLHEQLARYLGDPNLRARVAAAGYSRASPAYSYDARAREILNACGISPESG